MRNVIMMHSVGSIHTSWKEAWLSIETQQFKYLCKYLKRHKYRTHYLDYWYINEGKGIDKKDLFLTFDDGYLDNLLVAYPIMKKYGIKGTIFINPEFVDPSSGIRTLESNKGETRGFLNWDEIKFLDKTEEFDIQSHSMSHNFYFKSDKLIDIHDGSDKYHWLAWISRPKRKPFWQLESQGNFTPKGYPVFEYYRALGLRRYFPDEQLIKLSEELYNENTPKEQIIEQLNFFKKTHPGRFESDSEMEERFKYELFDSKRILEEKLNKQITILCWPGGGYNDASLRIAQEAGYWASTIASADNTGFFDNSGNIYKRIVRYPMSSNVKCGQWVGKTRVVIATLPAHLVVKMKLEEGDFMWKLFSKIRGLINRMK